jgi:hypothetical protein
MPVPPECEPLARSIQSLVVERTALRASLAALPTRERWRVMGEIGDLNLRIEGERLRFETCLNQHRAAYRASIVLFDTSEQPPPPGPRIAKLWRRRDAAPELFEEVPITDGALTFTRHRDAGGPIGVTIEETGDPRIKGPDLRSGWLPELPGTSLFDPDGRIELVLRAATISVAGWSQWVGTVEMPGTVSTPLGNAQITTVNVSVKPATGAIEVAASGEAKLPLPTGTLAGTFTFGASVQLQITSGSPDPTQQCEVKTRGTPTLTLGTTLAPVPGPIADLVRDALLKAAMSAIRNAVNAGLPRAVAASFGLDELPPGAVASLRSLEITPNWIAIGVAVGAFGDVLSTFTP